MAFDGVVTESDGVIAESAITEKPTNKRSWLIGLGIAALAGLALWTLGITPYVLMLVAAVVIAIAKAQISDLSVGISGALVALLGITAILLRLAYWLPGGLPLSGGLLLTATTAAALVYLARRRTINWPNRRTAIGGGIGLALSLFITAVLIPVRSAMGAAPVWAFHNDAISQMLKAWAQISDGGLNTTIWANPAPLTNALIAVSAAVGRLSVGDPNRILENDLLRAAEVWALMLIATVFLAGLVAWRTFGRGRTENLVMPDGVVQSEGVIQSDGAATNPLMNCQPCFWQRVIATALVALIPLTWYVAGISFTFGFYNSTLALLILLAAWNLYLSLSDYSPLVISLLLSLATVAMLATWAPVALIPASLTFLALIAAFKQIRLLNDWRSWAAWGTAALLIPAYGALVTLRDFGEQGEYLTNDGGIARLTTGHVFTVFALTALLGVIHAVLTRRWDYLWGLGALFVSSSMLIGFLMFLNFRAGQTFWNYYSIKAAWTVTSLLIIIALATVLSDILRWPVPRIARAAAIAVSAFAVTAVMLQYTFNPVSWRNFLAPMEVLRSTGSATAPWQGNILFDSYRHGQPTMLVRYNPEMGAPDVFIPGDGRTDYLANFWLLQRVATDGEDPIRAFAYLMDSHHDQEVCDAVATLAHGSMHIITTDTELEARLNALCPTANFTVEIETPVWPR